MQAEGMGLVIIATSMVDGTVDPERRRPRRRSSPSHRGGAGYPVGYLYGAR